MLVKDAVVSKISSEWATAEEYSEIDLMRRFLTKNTGKLLMIRKDCK